MFTWWTNTPTPYLLKIPVKIVVSTLPQLWWKYGRPFGVLIWKKNDFGLVIQGKSGSATIDHYQYFSWRGEEKDTWSWSGSLEIVVSDFIKGFRICSGQHSLRLSFDHPKPWFRLARGPSWGSQALRWRISGKLLPSTVVLRGKWYEFYVDTGHHLSLYHWGYMCHRNSIGNSYLHVEGVLSQGYIYI